MPQKSHGYAAGRVQVLSQSLLSASSLERLLSAGTVNEVARALSEMGWGEVHTKRDVERLANEQVRAACALVRECSSEPDATDCFLLKYDILNLKLLIKARVLGVSAGELSECGTLDPELLRRCVEENNYQPLEPALRDALVEIEKHIAVNMDPLYVDAELDKAYYALVKRKLSAVHDDAIKRYFSAKADLTNLLIALRSGRMGRSADFAAALFVPGGELPIDGLKRLSGESEYLTRLIYLKPYADRVKRAILSDGAKVDLAALEKQADDYLLGLIRPHRYETSSILPLIGYLLAREREAAALRLIVTAKDARVSEEAVLTRLRALYA